MILDTKKESELIEMLPNVVEITTLECTDEDLNNFASMMNLNIGDLVYCKDEDRVIQYMLVNWEKDQSVLMDDYKTLLPTLFETNEEVSATLFVEEFKKFKENATNIMKRCEANNIGYYLKYLQEQEKREDITEKELIEIKRKQRAIVDSVNFFYIKDMAKIVYNKKEYNKYKQLARKKMKNNTKFSFVNTNDNELLNILDQIHPSNKNKLFLMYLYKYIAESKMNTYNCLVIHFSLVNIIDMINPDNKMKDMLIEKLVNIINDL